MTNSNYVALTIKDGVATLKLNRPEKANAFDGEMWLALEKKAEEIRLNKEVRVVILTGEGKAFCGGLDLNQAAAEGVALGQEAARGGFDTLQYVSKVFTLYERLPVPVIAVINGGCIGLGLELALACDIRLAADHAVFSIPEVVFGLVPDCGGTQRLPRLVGPAMAKELILTGRRIDAAEALRIGLVNHLYPLETLLAEAEKMAAEIASHSIQAVQASKRCINAAQNNSLDAGLQFETASALSVLGDKADKMLRS
jgi:enoyl-CoA hydratase/carnithine racemase